MRSGLSLLRHPGLQRRAKVLAALSAAGLLLPLASRFQASLPDRMAWVLDLAVHWQWFYLAGLVLALIFLVFGRSRWAMAALLLPLPWLTATPAALSAENSGPTLTAAAANVHLENEFPDRLVEWVGTTRPDVLAILEISDTFAQRLALDETYPYRLVHPRGDPFGIALLSRHPIGRHRLVSEDGAPPRIEAVLDWNGTEVSVVALHPMPPISAADHARRNRLLADISARFESQPTLVIGDFNATPWSSAFQAPRARGFSIASALQSTWPASLRGLVGLPIDHVMVSRHWSLSGNAIGPDLGSDHLPTLAAVSLRGK